MPVSKEELVATARKAWEKAYAPYSKYQVGAALLGKSGVVYTGCNIENASFGATICAERVAACKAVSEGEREFEAVAIVVDAAQPVLPCGICRQFLAEFNLDLKLYLATVQGAAIETTTLRDFLPGAFGPGNLNK